MKKLLLLVVGIIVFCPLVVKAESYTSPDGRITCPEIGGSPGSVITCTYSYDFTNATVFSATFTPFGDTEMVDVIPLGTWAGTYDPVAKSISLTNTTPQTGRQQVFEVQYRIAYTWQSGDPCGIRINPVGGTATETPSDPSNPGTGSFLPYVLVGTGAILALAVYLQVSKKEKFYKI